MLPPAIEPSKLYAQRRQTGHTLRFCSCMILLEQANPRDQVGQWISGAGGVCPVTRVTKAAQQACRVWGGDEVAAAGLLTGSSSRHAVSSGDLVSLGESLSEGRVLSPKLLQLLQRPSPCKGRGRAPTALESKGGPVGQGLYLNPSLTLLFELMHPLSV